MPNQASQQTEQLANNKATAPLGRWLLLAAALIVLDQISKWYFELNFQFAERLNILPFFDFILVYNTGAAFSFLADHGGWQRWFFVALSIIASIVIVVLLRRNSTKTLFCLSLSLILAGAIGNLIDRIVYHYVNDFIYFSLIDFPIFNVADIYVTLSMLLLIILVLFVYKDEHDFSFIWPRKKNN